MSLVDLKKWLMKKREMFLAVFHMKIIRNGVELFGLSFFSSMMLLMNGVKVLDRKLSHIMTFYSVLRESWMSSFFAGID